MPEAKGPAQVTVPTEEIKPEDVGTLALEYRDGAPVIVVSAGTLIPRTLTVVDGAGDTAVSYTARADQPTEAVEPQTSRYKDYLGPWVPIR